MTTAKQNQKFPFHFFFRFAAEGWGEEAREKCKEIFWFCTRESVSVSEARIIGRQDSIQNTFELRSIHTAKKRNRILEPKWGRAEGAGVGKRARRVVTNSDGTGAAKWADLSLFHI